MRRCDGQERRNGWPYKRHCVHGAMTWLASVTFYLTTRPQPLLESGHSEVNETGRRRRRVPQHRWRLCGVVAGCRAPWSPRNPAAVISHTQHVSLPLALARSHQPRVMCVCVCVFLCVENGPTIFLTGWMLIDTTVVWTHCWGGVDTLGHAPAHAAVVHI